MNRFLKFILLSTFQLLTSMELGDNKFNIGLLSHHQNRENQIILTSVPMDMYKSYDEQFLGDFILINYIINQISFTFVSAKYSNIIGKYLNLI